MVKTFQERAGLKFAATLDSDGKVAKDYDVSRMPATFVIGKDGTIQAAHVGARPGTIDKDNLTKELEILLAGKSLIASAETPETTP